MFTGVPITRRQFLEDTAIIELAQKQGAVSVADIFVIKEAVASTALEHPEWDMEEKKTPEEWKNGTDR